jgi:hypothetical protein
MDARERLEREVWAWGSRWATRYLRRCCAVSWEVLSLRLPEERWDCAGYSTEGMFCSVKGRDAVMLLLLHVLYMYMVSIIGDVYNDGEMTGESSFQTTHVRLFHAC